MADIKRNLQEGGLYIDKWWTGLYKNRSPLFTPVSALGITLIAKRDALIDGLNMMLSQQYTLKRRYGFSKASSVAFNPGEWPLTFTSFQQLSGNVIPMVDTQTNVYTFGPNFKNSIYTKLPGSVESSFVSDLTWIYWVDGKSANKYDGTNVWNTGIAAPSSAPAISTIETGGNALGTLWQANTWFSTMGILIDSNNNAEQLTGVANNGSQFGLSGTGHPVWNNTPGSITTESTGVQWRNEGQLAEYDHFGGYYKFYNDTSFYGNGTQAVIPGYLWDTIHSIMYIQQFNAGAGIALPANPQGVRPNFSGVYGQVIYDNFCTFVCPNPAVSQFLNQPTAWAPGTVYNNSNPQNFVYQPSAPPSTAQTPVYLMKCITAGTSAGTYASPRWPANGTTGNPTTVDGQLTWTCLGSAIWATATPYTAWTNSSNHSFSAVKDPVNGNLHVCVKGGTSGNPTWGTTYGAQTQDGSVTWVCVGTADNWHSNTIYYLPRSGFNAPFNVSLGGAAILASGNVEWAKDNGVSGGTIPAGFATVALHGSTSDGSGALYWFNNGPVLPNSLTWSNGYSYAYSYKARTTTDFYSVPSVGPNGGLAVIPTPPGLIGQIGVGYTGSGFLPAPTGSKSGQISTASPVTLIPGSNPGAQNILTLVGSTDPQVDTIVIWRSKDGGGSSNMFELTEIPNPQMVNGQPGIVTFTDFQPDSVLNNQILAPIANSNNPPPTGLTLLVWHAGRLWGAVGNTLYFSGGPDTAPGVGQESWPPGNNFALPGNITSLTSTTQGLIISVNDDAYVTTGTTSGTFTVPILWQANFGSPSQNAVAQDGDNVFFFTTRGQIWHFSANGLSEIGYLNGVDFGSMVPANVYVAIHRSGLDEGLFVSDGSTGLWRYSQNSGSWDPMYTPVGGVKAIGSIETSNGVWQLLMGRPTGSGFILKRDLTLYSDDSSSYHAFATVGSLVVAPPRQVADISAVLVQAKVVGTYPTISVMLNEIVDISVFPATFTVLPNPVVDPPQLVGYQNTIYMKRHDFNAASVPLPHFVQHMQVKIDFGNDTVGNELYGLGLA